MTAQRPPRCVVRCKQTDCQHCKWCRHGI